MSEQTISAPFKGTTIISVRKADKVVIAGDGQVTFGNTVLKSNAVKVRRLTGGKVIGGFAGATADAFTLFERLEAKLDKHSGNLMRACVEMAKDWRTDKYLRKLEAMMLVADKDSTFLLSGTGDVVEPEKGVIGIGSGGTFAQAAALALLDNTKLPADEIARKALAIAGDICIYTNHNVVLEEISK